MTGDGLETQLPDLTGVCLDELDALDLEAEMSAVAGQVEKPRINLGTSGPPGRTD